jgi:LacI family transcriptional regulator
MTTSRRRPTLRTISQMTGLSLSTVSLSLRGGGNLRAETRKKIAEAARAVGYVPDRAGVRLRTGKTNVLALVLDGAETALGFSRQMIQGIGNAIAGSRYHLTVMPEFDRAASVGTIRYILDNRTADGVILTHTLPRDPRVAMLMEADFPFVTHGRTEFFTPHAYYDLDAERFVGIAVGRLAALGARRLMAVLTEQQTYNFHTIRTSFVRFVAERGLEGQLLCQDGSIRGRTQTIRDIGLALAGDPDRPHGILCDGELPALAMASGLKAGGLVIGRDLHLISKRTSDLLPTLFPEVECIEEDVFAAGQELTRLLIARIGGTPPERLQTLVRPAAPTPAPARPPVRAEPSATG